jgi:hypothetical protein
MASYVFYPGDGAQVDWPVPFPYLSKDHVKVYADGVEVTPNWINSALIRVSPAVPTGKVLLVQRVTVKTPLTVFENTNNLTAENLTLAEMQALFIAEEASDRAEQSIIIDDHTGQYDFNGRRATNVADPVADQDAVTRKWAETAMSSQVAQAITQAGISTTNASQTTGDRAAVAVDRATIYEWLLTLSAWKDIVEGWKNTIEGWKNTIEGWKNQVSTWKDQASASASAAATSASAASTSASNALTSEGKARTSEQNAKTSETNAAGSAAAAAASAASVDAANLLTKSGNLAGLTDKAAARSALALGAAATSDTATFQQIWAGGVTGLIAVNHAWEAAKFNSMGSTGSGTVQVDCSQGTRFHYLLTGNVTVFINNPKDGQTVDLIFVQDGVGGRTVSWNSNIRFPDGQAPAVFSGANSFGVIVSAVYNGVNQQWMAVGWKVN